MPEVFKLKWTVEGVSELTRILDVTYTKVINFRKPLKASSKFILEDVERNFATEGSLVGGWESLKESTVKGRMRLGYGGAHPILQRTGKLRRSFYSRVNATRALVSSESPYFPYHQSRLPRKTNLPRRAMLVLTERTRQNIVEEFHKFLMWK